MKGDFSNGPSHHMRGGSSNGPGQAGRREMSFPAANSGYNTGLGRQIKLRIRPGPQNKDEVFKPADKNLIMNLI